VPTETSSSNTDDLENYAFSLRNSLNSELKDKIPEDDAKKLSSLVDEVTSWLDVSQAASKSEYEERKKELESVATPIISKSYGAGAGEGAGAGAGGMPGGGAGGAGKGGEGPTVEEVD
jgi:heat shock protein 1/8